MLNSIAIIPDGNRRYAEKHNLPLRKVYSKSTDKMLEIVRWCKEQNIKTLTLWGFSSENWKRSKTEVNLVFGIFCDKMIEALQSKDLYEEGARIRIIGNLKEMPEKVQILAKRLEDETKANKKINLNILINYGGRDEIIQAINKAISEKKKKIGEEDFKKYLQIQDEPDLIIRTSGEMRLSGLMAFQSAYSELYFTKKYFPEFTKRDFLKAVEEFNQRKRRFGK
jgi:undecaprenyl diphosphate synthase